MQIGYSSFSRANPHPKTQSAMRKLSFGSKDTVDFREQDPGLESYRQSEAKRLGLPPHTSLNEINSVQEDRNRSNQAVGLGLEPTATWEQINAAKLEQTRKIHAANLGLDPHATWEQIEEADLRRQALDYGLTPDAPLEEIVAAIDRDGEEQRRRLDQSLRTWALSVDQGWYPNHEKSE